MTVPNARREALPVRQENLPHGFYKQSHPAYVFLAKRTVDLAAATVGLVLSAPLFCLVCLAIRLDSPGPALFRQQRVGRGGTTFTLLKFRTMRTGTPDLPTDVMQKQKVSPVTRVGGFLRRFSLDELPQLVNILRGEMSLVGPRPALPSQERLNALRRDAGVEELLPGITGWAQINGRDDLSDEEKVACDAHYREHQSFLFDLVILMRTFLPVLSGRGNR